MPQVIGPVKARWSSVVSTWMPRFAMTKSGTTRRLTKSASCCWSLALGDSAARSWAMAARAADADGCSRKDRMPRDACSRLPSAGE